MIGRFNLRISVFCLLGVSALVLSGCGAQRVTPMAAPSPPPLVPVGADGPSGGSSNLSIAYDNQILRYIGTDSSGWKNSDNGVGNFSDLYTKFELIEDSDQAGASGSSDPAFRDWRDYKAESGGAWAWLGLAAAETRTITTTAKISIHAPELSISIPLYSISHANGGGQGDIWATSFSSSYMESPLFKISPNTSLAIHLNAAVSQQVKSQAAALALKAVVTAVNTAVPTSALLTTLSSPQIASAGTAVDSAISNLLSDSISEDIELGRLASSWQPNYKFNLYGCAPFIKTEQNPKAPDASGVCGTRADIGGGYDKYIGEWHIMLSCPRLSAFDSRSICNENGDLTPIATPGQRVSAQAPIAAEVDDGTVLQFELSNQKTIENYVENEAWFTGFTTGDLAKKAKSDYAGFCANAVVDLESVGLTKFDAELTLRSMVREMPQLATLRVNFTADGLGGDCVSFIKDATGTTAGFQ